MPKSRIVFPVDHIPSRPPTISSLVLYMALDLYHAPGWLWGVTGTLMAVLWIGWIVTVQQQETRPLNGYGDQKEKA